MIDGLRVLGLITARGGSKGLPGKNIRMLRGKPLLAWTADVAKASVYLDALVLSTDSEEIAEVGRRHGVSVPFLRPPELASDTATSVDVVEHALQFLAEQGQRFDLIALLEPTSPLRETKDIDSALALMRDSRADSVVSVCSAESIHPAFMFGMSDRGLLHSTQPGGFKVLRRQELEPLFFLEGTMYASRIDTLLADRTFCQANTAGYEVPKWKSPEIDDIVDFLHVESIMTHMGLGE
ncbi:acylneuraminate cytidylyltransferase family protein [Uliginosibacterium sp. H1]|uniref:acylneuraminate cytidylyltransferase family protein n=1 Tax=Uliginosibacterium sp. H1 TaxID=3114757 RepID=UPI002E17A1E5|nr:acylneuraminate cytidylyltransferase family protein [Uliginosibacterium sp. H1]